MSDKIFVVDDDTAFRGMLVEALSEKGFLVEEAGSAEEALARLDKESFDVILLDVRLPGMTGLEAIPRIRQADPLADIIVMTAYSEKDPGLEAVRLGAYDFFTKPFSLAEMEVVIRRAMEKRKLQEKVSSLQKSLKRGGPSSKIIGDSPAMKRVVALIERVASLDTTVLILGESGTGKELISDTIHALSSRAGGPFIKLNCAAIPETLLESELFGHEKGAFTGATGVKQGKFELAKGGTILLDELGDMPIHLQPKLLRAVENKAMERLGGVKPVHYDVRIIAATNQALPELIKEKKFREDLYYRLNVASINLPPLRERREDIPTLAEHFLKNVNLRIGTDIKTVSADAMDALISYEWPGNVRQLANVIERAAIFCTTGVITSADIDMALNRTTKAGPVCFTPMAMSLRETLQEVEKNLILGALEKSAGVQTEAAKLLGISPKNLWNKLQKHQIDPQSVRPS